MKNLPRVLFLALLLSLAAPKRAEAGLVIGGLGATILVYGFASGTARHDGPALGAVLGFPLVLIGSILAATGAVQGDSSTLTLDASSSFPERIRARHPEIEDPAVAAALAAEILARAAEASPLANGLFYLTIPEARVRAILAPTGLRESAPEAFTRILADLT